MKLRSYFLFTATVLLLCLSNAQAGVDTKWGPNPTNKDLYSEIKDPEENTYSTFLKPNEQTPQYLPPILDNLTEGALITVGTERGFMTAAMMPQITNVYFTDSNQEAVLYNRINIQLLRIARNHADYVRLRAKAGTIEVTSRILFATGRFTPGQISWFIEAVRKRGGVADVLSDTYPARENRRVVSIPKIAFEANYVSNPVLGERLIAMAKAGRLSAHRVNLGDSTALAEFQLKVLKDDRVALIDISNAWWSSYIGFRRTRNLLKQLTQQNPQAIAVFTTRTPRENDWLYMAFPAVFGQNQKRWHTIETALKETTRAGQHYERHLPTSIALKYTDIRYSKNAFNSCDALFVPVVRP